MNSISIDNEKYVKATDIARELGYTADYVGQLCRAKKVKAQLVGRSWYVSEESIRSHKQTRYRSASTANKKTIETSLATQDLDSQDSFAVSVSTDTERSTTHYAGQEFYHKVSRNKPSSYFSDASELIPTGNNKLKTGRLSVSLGDSKSITIASNATEFDFSPTERSEVIFSGPLAVSDVYDDVVKEQDEQQDIQGSQPLISNVRLETKRPRLSTDITSTLKVQHLQKDKKPTDKNLPIEHNASGVLGMRRDRIVDRNPVGGTLKIAVPTDNDSVSGSGAYVMLVATVMSVTASVFILGIQAHVFVEGHTLLTSYTFTFDTLLAAVSTAW